jgi:hypothetical protein
MTAQRMSVEMLGEQHGELFRTGSRMEDGTAGTSTPGEEGER